MTLTVAMQMDPIETINFDGDSTFVLGLEAQRRGFELYYYTPADLSLVESRVMVHAHPVQLFRQREAYFRRGARQRLELSSFDVILLRQDPPFDLAYITTTHVLEHVQGASLVVNDPVQVRNAPEKLLATHFPELMPPTLISSSMEEITAFRRKYQDIIIKPLYGHGGFGVFHFMPGDENLSAFIEFYSHGRREPLMVQRYIPEVRQGDKRIILVEGEPKGAVMRVPASGEARANMHVGGVPVKTVLTRREHEICEAIGPALRERGLIFVGIDVIGDYLTEINVTCPTGLQEIDRLNEACLEADIWDAIEQRLGRVPAPPAARASAG